MKKILYYCLILSFCSSCSYRYQLFDVASIQVQELPDEDIFLFENDSLEIVYDLWTDGGTLLYRIQNKLDRPLYLAMDKSYFGINGDKITYYRPQEQNPTILAPPNEELIYSPFGNYNPLVKIPAKEGYWLEGFPITYTWFNTRGEKIQKYDLENSPVRFENYLAMSWNEDDFEVIEHQFWIAGLRKLKGKELKAYEDSFNSKTDKFYVSRSPEERPEMFWLEVGLSVFEELLYLLTF